jgi:GNAT superfamily N-acetyltransferase
MDFLQDVARRFWEITPYRVGDVDPQAVDDMVGGLIDGSGVVFRHEWGAIGGFVSPMWMSPSVLVASELFWWSEREGLALLRAFEDWAKDQGAVAVNMIGLATNERAGRIYERRGYAPVEQVYRRAI